MSKYKNLDFNSEDFQKMKISELKRIAEYWFRQYLLSVSTRSSRGEIYCPLKERWYPENKIQVAHFRDRHHLDTAFDLDNCHLISEQSNVWDAKVPKEDYKSLHHYDYEMWLREKISDKKMEKLLDNRRDLTIFARDIYMEVIKKYKNDRE